MLHNFLCLANLIKQLVPEIARLVLEEYKAMFVDRILRK